MKGKTYGEWEGHADGNLSGGGEKDLPNYVAVSASIDLYEFAGLGGDLNVGIYKIIRKDKEEGGTLYKHMRHRLKHRKRPAGEKIPIKNLVSIDKRPKLSIPKTVSEIGSLIRLSAKITGGQY